MKPPTIDLESAALVAVTFSRRRNHLDIRRRQKVTATGERPPSRRTESGFILFEVMIAITVFAIVAMSLATAMNTTIQSSNYLNRQASIRHGMTSILNEALRQPKLKEMTLHREDKVLGVNYRTETKEMRFVNVAGDSVKGLYTLRAVAAYTEDGEERQETAEVYVRR